MTPTDQQFLISFEMGEPDWGLGYSPLAEYPSVKWKLQNLQRLKASNPKKLVAGAEQLKRIFGL